MIRLTRIKAEVMHIEHAPTHNPHALLIKDIVTVQFVRTRQCEDVVSEDVKL